MLNLKVVWCICVVFGATHALLSYSGINEVYEKEGDYMHMHAFYSNKSVLITGGCGFIGSHLAEKLVEFGAQVTIIDDLSTGFLDNIAVIYNKITYLNKSIIDFDACVAASQGQDIIFHCAALVSVPQSIEQPRLCHHVNVDGTFNLLEAGRRSNVKRFVFSSSSAVYGQQEFQCSEDTPCSPQSPYGFSKLMGELCCKQYAQSFGLETVILRYFNVFGLRQNPHNPYAAAIAKFMHCMQHNIPITIYGDGQQTRDFVPIEHVVFANLLAGMLPAEQVCGQVFNIATGHSTSLLTMIEKLKEQFPHYAHAITFKPARKGDIRHSNAACSKFNKLIEQSV